MMTEYCGVCGELIVGCKGDYWHLIDGKRLEMRGDDGHLAHPQINDGFKCLEPNCRCDFCGWYCSCGCNAPGGACSETSDSYKIEESSCFPKSFRFR